MTISRTLPAVLALILAAGACDNKTEPEEQLTAEESVALLKGMVTLATDTTVEKIHESADSTVIACPQGGRAKLVGTVTEEQGDTARLHVTFQVTPTGCAVTGDEMRFTVDGDPSFVHRTTIEIIQGTLETRVRGAITGDIDWELGQRSGGCTMDITLDAEPNLETGGLDGAFTGTMCGHEVEVDAADLVRTSGSG